LIFEKHYQLRRLVLWTVVITAAHFIVGTRSHLIHGGHILLGMLYMLPVLIGAVGFGLRGGVLTALAVMAIYSAHILISWAGRPMANPDQWAMLGAYLFVGASAGGLVRQAERRKWERDEVIARSARSETIRGLTALATALGERDPGSLRHSEHVARACQALGAHMGLGREEIDRLRLAGLVHDVGKIGIADDVLFSDGQLDERQRRAMHEHPLRAAAMVRSIYGGDDIARIVEAHHEHPDGSGYPKGLRGEEIPLPARLLRVADVFTALSEERRYKPAMTRDTVMATMRAMSGSSIDRGCFDALERAVNQGLIPEVATEPASASQGAAAHD
jgi:putative nucleotidyltransferase with HDIG domain